MRCESICANDKSRSGILWTKTDPGQTCSGTIERSRTENEKWIDAYKSIFHFPPSSVPLRRGGFYQLSSRIKNRVAPPETAPKVAPFLPPMAAPIAVAMPAVAAIRRVSFSQDRRFPPPHTTIPAFIYTSTEKFLIRQAHSVPCKRTRL